MDELIDEVEPSIPASVYEAISGLNDIEECIARAQQQVKDLKESRQLKLLTIFQRLHYEFSELPIAKAQELAGHLYWADKRLSGTIKDAYKQVFGGIYKPPPRPAIRYCEECESIIPDTMTSWSGANQSQYYICSQCKEKREQKWKAADEARQRRLTELRTMPYKAYLQSSEWQETRKDALRRARYRCQVCNSDGRLNVHHRTYERRGCEYASDLLVLCSNCHETFHEVSALVKE